MRRLAVFVGFALCLPSAAARAQDANTPAAQAAKSPREPGPIEESANRIARDWWPSEPAARFTIDEQGRPHFSTGTIETLPPPPWRPSLTDSITPARGAISHQEMVRMMTPQEFSTPLIGMSTDPGEMLNSIKKAWREWQARRIHARVEKELEEFERMRAAAGEKSDDEVD
jgi:hypothetical protein